MYWELKDWIRYQHRHISYAWQECRAERSPFKWWKINDIYTVYKFEKALEERDNLESY